MADRRNPFVKLTDNAFEEENQRLTGMFGESFAQPKAKRPRRYEKENQAYVYHISSEDEEAVDVMQGELRAILERLGNRSTIDDLARIFAEYALDEYGDNLNLTPTNTGKPKLVLRKKAQGWEEPTPLELKKVSKKKAKIKHSRTLLAYRWSADVDKRIRAIAGEIAPRQYRIPLGKVVVRLLTLAIHDFKNQKFELDVETRSVEQKVSGWTVL